ncbi:MAG: FliG C-terminal domain-containing protein [Elusimicrobiota bacterium]|nr:FliG C-terminal domain-containing protein [Elusimicrobiota bacterium]
MRASLFAALIALLSSAPPPAAAGVVSPNLGLLQEQNHIKADAELKIQRDVLDPILGKGKAAAFVDVEMEIKLESEESMRSGMGVSEKYKEKAPGPKGGMQTTFVLPGIPKPKTITQGPETPDRPEASQAQQAQQMKGVQEERFALKPTFKRLQVTVIHDDTVLDPLKDAERLTQVRERIVDAMGQYQLTQDKVVFRPTKFDKPPLVDWREDFKKPSVYLPLLYALLLLLFLSFLFGPLRRFFQQYVSALRESKKGEFEVLNKAEDKGEDGENEGDDTLEELTKGELDIMLGRKPPEPLVAPTEEDEDAMKKFEPFTYITEENFKRLANLFLVRQDEPWLVTVVLSYLKPEIARATLTLLPVELQAKIAIEALKIRQVTREQLMAIDADIKESVDFVVGGMERLTQMLDEADTATRANILEYLKNEKPDVYQRVRKFIMTFDDVVGFPDRDMQTIVRELKTEAMAKALQGAPPDVVNKFLSNMSAGAASLLKESIEYATGLTPSQIEEERSKIMDVVKVLEKEGKVNVRQSRGDAYSGFHEEVANEGGEKYAPRTRAAEQAVANLLGQGGGAAGQQPAVTAALPAPSPAAAAVSPAQAVAAKPYLDAGIQYHDAGRFQEAAQYLEYALAQDGTQWQGRQYLANCYVQLGRTKDAIVQFEQVLLSNPDPGLRQWVDGMKAQAI